MKIKWSMKTKMDNNNNHLWLMIRKKSTWMIVQTSITKMLIPIYAKNMKKKHHNYNHLVIVYATVGNVDKDLIPRNTMLG